MSQWRRGVTRYARYSEEAGLKSQPKAGTQRFCFAACKTNKRDTVSSLCCIVSYECFSRRVTVQSSHRNMLF